MCGGGGGGDWGGGGGGGVEALGISVYAHSCMHVLYVNIIDTFFVPIVSECTCVVITWPLPMLCNYLFAPQLSFTLKWGRRNKQVRLLGNK